MTKTLHCLIVDDSEDDALLEAAELHRGGYDVPWERVDTAETMRSALERQPWDVVLCDYKMPRFGGLAALELLKASGRDLPCIIVSGTIGEDIAVAMMKAGAHDYIMKDKLARLLPAVERELRDAVGRRERRQAEAALAAERDILRASRQQFQAVFEQAAVGMVIAEGDRFRILKVNQHFCEIFGYSAEELLQLTFRDITHPDDIPTDVEKAKKISAGIVQGSSWEKRYRKKDGTTVWARVFVAPLDPTDANSPLRIGVIEDITERKQAEERLREQAALLDTTSDAIYVTTLDGTIRSWNRGAEQTYGWSFAEALDRKATELLSLPGCDTADPMAAVLQEGDWSGDRRQKTKAGREVVVFARLALVRDAAGKPVSVFTIDTDITEKKQLEARFMQAQRLENLGALASGIAHDLNNVLAPILMASEILRSKARTDSERNMLATIATCARRGANIIRQVLTFARGIEGKRIALQPRHLLSEMAEIARETFPKNIELEMDLANNLWPVLGDATQLHQVLMNLCVNARDAMPEGGRLSLKATNTELDETFVLMTPGAKAGPYVLLTVSDTGAGIPPEHFDKIFTPFYTTKASGKGTGLGLPTTLGIVKSHGGLIQFKSQLGKGTCFEIYLPATPDAKPGAEPRRAAPPRGKSELILIVDDEISIRKVTTGILEASGYRVVSAAEGTEALAVFMQNRTAIAAIVTDMLMPGMDGPTFVRVVRRIDPGIRIIGISGMGEGISEYESLAMSALLTKPFTGRSLLFTLDAVLRAPPGTKVEHADSPWLLVSETPLDAVSGSADNCEAGSPDPAVDGETPGVGQIR